MTIILLTIAVQIFTIILMTYSECAITIIEHHNNYTLYYNCTFDFPEVSPDSLYFVYKHCLFYSHRPIFLWLYLTHSSASCCTLTVLIKAHSSSTYS